MISPFRAGSVKALNRTPPFLYSLIYCDTNKNIPCLKNKQNNNLDKKRNYLKTEKYACHFENYCVKCVMAQTPLICALLTILFKSKELFMKISFTVFGKDPLGFPQSCFTTLNLLNSGSSPSASDTFSFFFSPNHFHSKWTEKN